MSSEPITEELQVSKVTEEQERRNLLVEFFRRPVVEIKERFEFTQERKDELIDNSRNSALARAIEVIGLKTDEERSWERGFEGEQEDKKIIKRSEIVDERRQKHHRLAEQAPFSERVKKNFAVTRLIAKGIRKPTEIIELIVEGGFLTRFVRDKQGELQEQVCYGDLLDKNLIDFLKKLDDPVLAFKRLNALAPHDFQRLKGLHRPNTEEGLNRIYMTSGNRFDVILKELNNYTFARPFTSIDQTRVFEEVQGSTNFDLLSRIISGEIILDEQIRKRLDLAQSIFADGFGAIHLEEVLEVDVDALELLALLAVSDIETNRYSNALGVYHRSYEKLREQGLLEAARKYLKAGFRQNKDRNISIFGYASLDEEKQKALEKFLVKTEEFLSDDKKHDWLILLGNNSDRDLLTEREYFLAKSTVDVSEHLTIAAALVAQKAGMEGEQAIREIFFPLVYSQNDRNDLGRELLESLEGVELKVDFFDFLRVLEKINPASFDFSQFPPNVFELPFSDRNMRDFFEKYSEVVQLYRKYQGFSDEDKLKCMQQLEMLSTCVFVQDSLGNCEFSPNWNRRSILLKFILDDPSETKNLVSSMPQSSEELRVFEEREEALQEKLFTNVTFLNHLYSSASTQEAIALYKNYEYISEHIERIHSRLEKLGFEGRTYINSDLNEYVWIGKLGEEEFEELQERLAEGKLEVSAHRLPLIKEYFENRKLVDKTIAKLRSFYHQQAKVFTEPSLDIYSGEFYSDEIDTDRYIAGQLDLNSFLESLIEFSKIGNRDEALRIAVNLWEYGYEPGVGSLTALSKAVGEDVKGKDFLDVCLFFRDLSGDDRYFDHMFHADVIADIARLPIEKRLEIFDTAKRVKSLGIEITTGVLGDFFTFFQRKNRAQIESLAISLGEKKCRFHLESADLLGKVVNEGKQQEYVEMANSLQEFIPEISYELVKSVVELDDSEGIIQVVKALHISCGLEIKGKGHEDQQVIDLAKDIHEHELKDRLISFFKRAKKYGFSMTRFDFPPQYIDFVTDSEEIQDRTFAFMKYFYEQSPKLQGSVSSYSDARRVAEVLVTEEEGEKIDHSQELLARIAQPEFQELTITLPDLELYINEVMLKGKVDDFEDYLKILKKFGYEFSNKNLHIVVDRYLSEDWPGVGDFLDKYLKFLDRKNEEKPELEVRSEGVRLKDSDIDSLGILIRSGIKQEDLIHLYEMARTKGISLDTFLILVNTSIFSNPETLSKALFRHGLDIIEISAVNSERFKLLFPVLAKTYVAKGEEDNQLINFGEALEDFKRYPVDDKVWEECRSSVLATVLGESGENSRLLLEMAAKSENAVVLKVLSRFASDKVLDLNLREDLNTFNAFVNEIGVFYE